MSAGSQLQKYIDESAKARARLEHDRGIEITDIEIQTALVEVLDLETELALPSENLTAEQMIEELSDYEFSGEPETLETVKLNDSIIPDGIPKLLTEERVKNNNEIWEINKYDPDPFPSDPHAHNLETGLKLDLSNGDLYRKRDYVDSIREKELIQIRKKINHNDLPNLDL